MPAMRAIRAILYHLFSLIFETRSLRFDLAGHDAARHARQPCVSDGAGTVLVFIGNIVAVRLKGFPGARLIATRVAGITLIALRLKLATGIF